MYEGSPARLVLGGVLIAALAAGLAWTLWGMRGDSRAAPAISPSAPSASLPSASPSASPEPTAAPVGPATGDYAELATSAELEHPDTDPHIARWYRWFGYFIADEHVAGGEWTNKQKLWDSLAPGIRVEAESLGSPFPHPLYDGDTAQPATADVRWSTSDTAGRGEAVEFSVTYKSEKGRVTTRYWAALISADADGSGRVLKRMEPFDLLVTDYDDFDSFRAASADRIWAWIEKVHQ